jgi:hypothetical protein
MASFPLSSSGLLSWTFLKRLDDSRVSVLLNKPGAGAPAAIPKRGLPTGGRFLGKPYQYSEIESALRQLVA